MTYTTLHILNNNDALRIFFNSKGQIYFEVSEVDKETEHRGISITLEDAKKLEQFIKGILETTQIVESKPD